MARRGIEDGWEVIIVLGCALLLYIGNQDRLFAHNPLRPPHLDLPDQPEWCSGILIVVIILIVVSWFRERD
jgi:hypothetical protein